MTDTKRRYVHDFFSGKTFRDGIAQMTRGPSWYCNMFNNRPVRRKNKKVCVDVMKGEDYDNIAEPPGNRKPHRYFW